MSMYAPVDDMEGKSPAEVLRELAWTRRQRADLIAARDSHAKDRGEAEHRRSKAERALADARRSFRGALDALGRPRTITTAEELDALAVGSVILDPIGLSLHKNPFTGWNSSNGAKEIDPEMLAREALPATVLYEPSGE